VTIALWVVIAILAVAVAALVAAQVSARRALDSLARTTTAAEKEERSDEEVARETLRSDLMAAVESARSACLAELREEAQRLDAKIGHLAAQATAEGLDAKLNHLEEMFHSHMKGYQHV